MAIIAGADTTSSVLSNIFWCLLNHPDVYTRLQEEIDKFYPSSEDSLNGKHLQEMMYLEAVM